MSRLNLIVSRGSAVLYRGDSLPTAMSLISASLTSDRRTLHAIRKCISARGLAYGRSPCAAPACPTPVPFGQPHSLASLSPRQAKAMGLLTSGTYGPNSSISSSSAALKLSLANRLRQRTDLLGSTLFNLTWKERVTPSGRSIPALRASVRRTSVNECTGWPTTRSSDAEKNVRTLEGSLREIERKGTPQDLCMASTLASWNTPSARDHKDTPGMATTGINPDGTTREHVDPLPRQAMHLTSWQTTFLCGKDIAGSGITPLPTWGGPARLTASGHLVTGYSAETVSGDQLNPEHSRWLMACPAQWAQAAPNFEDWQRWQDLMQSLSPEQKNIALGRSAPTATPSISNKPPSFAGLRSGSRVTKGSTLSTPRGLNETA